MTIEKQTDGSTATLKLIGWLDTNSAPDLTEEINKLGPETTDLILEMDELQYISSAGLRRIAAAREKVKGELTLRNPSIEILNVICMTGFDRFVKIEP